MSTLLRILAIACLASTAVAATLQSITITPANAYVQAGSTRQFTATGHYSDGTNRNITTGVTWASSAPVVSTIATGGGSPGLATTTTAGPTTISATMTAITGQTTMNVQIPASFFALDVNKNNTVDNITTDPWPSTVAVPFATYRTLGSAIKWSDVYNCTTNAYDRWSRFDAWLAQAQANGQDVMFTAFYTPSCLSSNPTASCAFGNDGGCYPPNDVFTGDNNWKTFLTTLVSHAGVGRIQFLEVWNEPNVKSEWQPANQNQRFAELLVMAQDAQCVLQGIGTGCSPGADPGIKLVSPPATTSSTNDTQIQWISDYLGAGGGAFADIIGFHGYTVEDATHDQTEDEDQLVNYIQGLAGGLNASKPIFDTEGSWGQHAVFTSDQQISFTGRYYLLQAARGVNKFSWYGWDFLNTGHFWDNSGSGVLTQAGTAYQTVHSWLTGASPKWGAGVETSCTTTIDTVTGDTVWRCDFTRTNGYQARAIWDASCSATNISGQVNCTSGQFCSRVTPSTYADYRTLDGAAPHTISGSVCLNKTPILLEK